MMSDIFGYFWPTYLPYLIRYFTTYSKVPIIRTGTNATLCTAKPAQCSLGIIGALEYLVCQIQ